jgi:hypothetical protein
MTEFVITCAGQEFYRCIAAATAGLPDCGDADAVDIFKNHPRSVSDAHPVIGA